MSAKPIIVREIIAGIEIRQTTKDGYFDATAICQAHGKLFGTWRQNASTQEFLDAVSLTIGIPIIKLVQSIAGRYGGTWVHPLVANNLAQWCSPVFAVKVAMWIEDLKRGRYPQAQANDASVLPILERHTAIIEEHDGRLIALETPKREKKNPQHTRLLRLAVRRMGGKCPCGCGRDMLNPDGSFVLGAQEDHWNELRLDNRLVNKWLIFPECHTTKHKNRHDAFLAFCNFQMVLARVEEEDKAIIPPSPRARQIIEDLNAKWRSGREAAE